MIQLKPAIRVNGKVLSRGPQDSHASLIEHFKLKDAPESAHGFTLDGKTFLSRKMAVGWMKAHDPKAYEKIKDAIKPEGLHSSDYARAKGISQVEPEKIDLSTKKVLVFDKGLYLYLAQKLGESFGKAYYYLPESCPYPQSPKSRIGTGLPEVERVKEFWKYVDQVDCIAFFDCYEGDMQDWLRGKGYRVFGGGSGEKLELDKVFLLETLKEVGLPVPKTYRAEGLDDLVEHLSGKSEKWLKTLFRGDFETKKYTNMRQLTPWLDDLRTRIGRRAKDIEILVQDPIEAECEIGYDGFCVDGEYTKNCLAGYEIKDKGLVAKVMAETPEILERVNRAVSPLFKKHGYRGHFSTEIRVTKAGKPYFIDPSCRAPSPPSELMCELYQDYAEAVWQISGGVVPELTPKAPFGAEVILASPWHDEHELYVEFPKEIRPNVKLKNHQKNGPGYTVVPNSNGGFFGAAVAYGGSVEEATQKCMEIVEQIECDELDFDPNIFEKAAEAVESGEAYGIHFGGKK